MNIRNIVITSAVAIALAGLTAQAYAAGTVTVDPVGDIGAISINETFTISAADLLATTKTVDLGSFCALTNVAGKKIDVKVVDNNGGGEYAISGIDATDTADESIPYTIAVNTTDLPEGDFTEVTAAGGTATTGCSGGTLEDIVMTIPNLSKASTIAGEYNLSMTLTSQAAGVNE